MMRPKAGDFRQCSRWSSRPVAAHPDRVGHRGSAGYPDASPTDRNVSGLAEQGKRRAARQARRTNSSPAGTPAKALYDLISEQWLLPPMSDAAQEVPLAS